MRFLFLALACLLATVAMAATAWVSVALDERVTVAFPVEPERRGNTDQLGLFCQTPRADLSATRRLLPAKYAPRNPTEARSLLLSLARGAARAAGDGRLISTRDVTIGEAAGLEATYVVSDADGKPGPISYKRLWLLNRTLYLLDFATRREGKHTEQDRAHFFDSVQVAPAPAPPPAKAVARNQRARRK